MSKRKSKIDAETPSLSGNAFTRNVSSSEAPLQQTDTENPHQNSSEVFSAGLQELISSRAYTLAEERGFTHGHDVTDWLRAEIEVLAAPSKW